MEEANLEAQIKGLDNVTFRKLGEFLKQTQVKINTPPSIAKKAYEKANGLPSDENQENQLAKPDSISIMNYPIDIEPNSPKPLSSQVEADLAEILGKAAVEPFDSANSAERTNPVRIETILDLMQTVADNLQLVKDRPDREEAPLQLADALYELHVLGITKAPGFENILREIGESPTMQRCIRGLLKEGLDDSDINKIKKYMAVGTDLRMDQNPKMANTLKSLQKFVDLKTPKT